MGAPIPAELSGTIYPVHNQESPATRWFPSGFGDWCARAEGETHESWWDGYPPEVMDQLPRSVALRPLPIVGRLRFATEDGAEHVLSAHVWEQSCA